MLYFETSFWFSLNFCLISQLGSTTSRSVVIPLSFFEKPSIGGMPMVIWKSLLVKPRIGDNWNSDGEFSSFLANSLALIRSDSLIVSVWECPQFKAENNPIKTNNRCICLDLNVAVKIWTWNKKHTKVFNSCINL